MTVSRTRWSSRAGIPGVEHGGKSILIVEDDALVREYVVTQIGSLGYLTMAASNAAEALAMIDGPERSICFSPT